MQIKIAPSIVASDLSNLERAVAQVEAAGADLLHVDAADGHFVPNIMLGPQVAAAVVRCARVPVGAHLMMTDPLRYAPAYAEAGVDTLFFHVEVADDLIGAVRELKGLGVEAGIAIKPGTPPESVLEAAGEADCLMVMTVEPGFSGQSFMPEACEKIPALRRAFGSDIDIYVDGGVGPQTAGTAVGYGANVLVAGYAVFHADMPPGEAIERLRRAAEAALEGDEKPL
jgi:ribulose-phosphate 3-epimerase